MFIISHHTTEEPFVSIQSKAKAISGLIDWQKSSQLFLKKHVFWLLSTNSELLVSVTQFEHVMLHFVK